MAGNQSLKEYYKFDTFAFFNGFGGTVWGAMTYYMGIPIAFLAFTNATKMQIGLVTAIFLCLADVPFTHVVAIFFFVAVVAVIFSCAGFLSAMWSDDFERLSIFQTYLLTPLTYLGGIFYSIDMLPGIWRDISLFNPILYMINTFRYGMLGISDIGLPVAYSVIIGFIVVLFLYSLSLLQRGVGIRS